ncbi:mechanosensitive ion channel protein MscS [bacterium]|nr:mechanosensitive ion channel protein MscS [bacterium]MAZ30124.1 mechanosensitive ion channel protein MscS [bacterium]
MFDSLTNSASNVAALVPTVETTLPGLGTVDLAPYLVALGIFVGITLFTKLVLVVVLARLRVLSSKTATDIDDTVIDAVSGIRLWVYSLIAAYIALSLFTLPDWFNTAFSALVYVAVVWQVIEAALCFIRYGTKRLVEKDEDGDGVVDPNAATASDMINLLARIVLYVFGLIFVLSNLGIEVTSLVAGLGIGGIAVAFALQGILSDLFASFSIYFDKPFRVGDFVIVGADMGTVEKIGIKTTRLRTLQGEELVVSNAELTTARVQNFKKMEERRIVTELGVTYETSPENVRAIDGIVREIIDGIDGIRFDRAHFKAFGDSALIFEVVYYVESDDYVQYMDAQEQFNLGLFDAFSARGIDFAYPTQTIYHQGVS